MVDVMYLSDVQVNPEGLARVGPGNKLKDIAEKLHAAGGRYMPHGSSPTVGGKRNWQDMMGSDNNAASSSPPKRRRTRWDVGEEECTNSASDGMQENRGPEERENSEEAENSIMEASGDNGEGKRKRDDDDIGRSELESKRIC